MMTMKSLKTAFYVGAALMISGIGVVHAASQPVVVELYGKNACTDDTQVQDRLLEILQQDKNVILVNCRRLYKGANEDHRYTLDFCNDRVREYSTKFGYSGLKTPMIIVNGRWDAFRKDITPAVKMGETDTVYPITVKVSDGNLDIEIPDIESDAQFGSLFLYAYLPTQGKKKIIVDPDVVMTPALEQKIREKKNVPFVQEAHVTNFYLRPVIRREVIGSWNGNKVSMTYSLDDITAMAGDRAKDLSYVVVLQEGGDYGPIIAAGEVVSNAELVESLPKSEPLEIEYTSYPTPTSAPIATLPAE